MWKNNLYKHIISTSSVPSRSFITPEEESAYVEFADLMNNSEFEQAYSLIIEKPYLVQNIMGRQAARTYEKFGEHLGWEKAVSFGIIYFRSVLTTVDSSFLALSFFPDAEERKHFSKLFELVDKRYREIMDSEKKR
jgi:hypothetical protein